MFIFYDTETTGTNIVFDQILQFAAVLTDGRLREIGRFTVRCRLLPWVVPSPEALLITRTPVDSLCDPKLPTFFEMMEQVERQLAAWGPAIFIGYNSMRFDEPLLQRALWQSLASPYVTVTNGSSRLDLLTLIRASTVLLPEGLVVPMRDSGGPDFRLDRIAKKNGFEMHKAHDALGDVDATLFIARLLADRSPTYWQLLVDRASKSATASILTFGHPVLLFDYSNGLARTRFAQRVDEAGSAASHAIVAWLDYDWTSFDSQLVAFDPNRPPVPLRRVALNKAPLVFSVNEAEKLWGHTCTEAELAQAAFLASNRSLCEQLTASKAPGIHDLSNTRQLEEMIFDGFPSKVDEEHMKEFRAAHWPERAAVATTFEDKRYRRLAQRMLYVSAPGLLSPKAKRRIRKGIDSRINAYPGDAHLWRSVQDALAELLKIERETFLDGDVREIEDWLLAWSMAAATDSD